MADPTPPTPPPPARSAAELEVMLADRERRLRELTEQTLGILEQLTEARARTRGNRHELERQIATLQQLLTTTEQRVRRSGRMLLGQRQAAADAEAASHEIVCWHAGDGWTTDALGSVLRSAGDTTVTWVGPRAAAPDTASDDRLAALQVHGAGACGTLAQTWNEALAATSAPWVVFVAPGLQIEDGTVGIADDEAVAIAAGTRAEGDRTIGHAVEAGGPLRLEYAEALPAQTTVEFACPEVFAVRRAAYRAVGLFDQGMHGAMALAEWGLRSAELGFKTVQSTLRATGAAWCDGHAERDRMMAVARHRPSELGAAMASSTLFWSMNREALQHFVQGLVARMPPGASERNDVITAVLTGACTATLPDPDAVAKLRQAAADLSRALSGQHAPAEATRNPRQPAAPGPREADAAPAELAGWIARMAAATAEARTDSDERARARAKEIEGLRTELRNATLAIQDTQRGAQEAQRAHDNAVRALEGTRAELAARDARIAQFDKLTRTSEEARATLEKHAETLQGQLALQRQHAEELERARADAHQRLAATTARLEEAERQGRELDAQVETLRQREATLAAEREQHRRELATVAEAIHLAGSSDAATVRERLRSMQEDLDRYARALAASGEPTPEALAARLVALRGLVRSRNQWIGVLLDELASRRLKLRPRGLQPHEAEFLASVRRDAANGPL